jgi:orsellinic acid C2-O-methyltransferase
MIHAQQKVDASADDATALLEMIGASWKSQVVCVAAELRIADFLADGPLTNEDLARKTECHGPSLARLMRALTSLGMCVDLDDGIFALTPTGELLRTDVPRSVNAWAVWWGKYHWPVWGNLLHSVRTGATARELVTGQLGYAHIENDPQAASVFNRAMVGITGLIAGAVVRTYDFSAAKTVVDIGGGYGVLLTAILLANREATGIVFDLPHAMDGAAKLAADAGVAQRVSFIRGDFFSRVPESADIYLLKSVLHNWNDERCSVILTCCRRAMAMDAKLVLVERIMPAHVQNAVADQAVVRADLNMLVGLGGRERTAAEFIALLAASGFRVTKLMPAAYDFSVIEGIAI